MFTLPKAQAKNEENIMETPKTIEGMLARNTIFVPTYQRAYSWDRDTQVKTFLADLEEYNRSKTDSKYYFGHFLFEEKTENHIWCH